MVKWLNGSMVKEFFGYMILWLDGYMVRWLVSGVSGVPRSSLIAYRKSAI